MTFYQRPNWRLSRLAAAILIIVAYSPRAHSENPVNSSRFFLGNKSNITGSGPDTRPNHTSGVVTVCTSWDGSALDIATRAEEIASRMFANIGVLLAWRGSGNDCPTEAIIVNLTTRTPHGLRPNALAYALPHGASYVRVFLDRIHELSVTCPSLERPLLAHVLAHEITHILQGTDGHSDRGVMKARWDQNDYYQMRSGGLAFTPEDVRLIRSSIARQAAQ